MGHLAGRGREGRAILQALYPPLCARRSQAWLPVDHLGCFVVTQAWYSISSSRRRAQASVFFKAFQMLAVCTQG